MDDNAEHVGGCLCGEVRYKALGQPKVKGVCHCQVLPAKKRQCIWCSSLFFGRKFSNYRWRPWGVITLKAGLIIVGIMSFVRIVGLPY